MAAFLFMHRMSSVVAMESDLDFLEQDVDDLSRPASDNQQARLPAGVAAFRISGPLFFAVANRLDDVLNQYPDKPKVFILRMRQVPLIDASGAAAIEQFLDRCRRSGMRVILSGAAPQVRATLRAMGISEHPTLLGLSDNFEQALQAAAGEVGD